MNTRRLSLGTLLKPLLCRPELPANSRYQPTSLTPEREREGSKSHNSSLPARARTIRPCPSSGACHRNRDANQECEGLANPAVCCPLAPRRRLESITFDPATWAARSTSMRPHLRNWHSSPVQPCELVLIEQSFPVDSREDVKCSQENKLRDDEPPARVRG